MQIFPTDKLKIEPWIINGWQSYGMFNEMPGFGLQVLWRPTGWFSLLSNSISAPTRSGNSDAHRYHSDDSVQVKYFDEPADDSSTGAFSFTFDLGCEEGGGVSCAQRQRREAAVAVLRRLHALQPALVHGAALGLTGRRRRDHQSGPLPGAAAADQRRHGRFGHALFHENPGDQFWAWDTSETLDYMPSQFVTSASSTTTGRRTCARPRIVRRRC